MKSTSVLSSSPMYCTIFLFTHGLILPFISESSTTPQSKGKADSLALSDGMLSISSLCFCFLSCRFVLATSFSFEPNGANLRFFGFSSSSSSSLNISDTFSFGRLVITIGFCASWVGVDLFESVFSEMGLKAATWTCWLLSGSGVASLETCVCMTTAWWGIVCGLSNSELLTTTVDVSVVMMFSLLTASTFSSSTFSIFLRSFSSWLKSPGKDEMENRVPAAVSTHFQKPISFCSARLQRFHGFPRSVSFSKVQVLHALSCDPSNQQLFQGRVHFFF